MSLLFGNISGSIWKANCVLPYVSTLFVFQVEPNLKLISKLLLFEIRSRFEFQNNNKIPKYLPKRVFVSTAKNFKILETILWWTRTNKNMIWIFISYYCVDINLILNTFQYGMTILWAWLTEKLSLPKYLTRWLVLRTIHSRRQHLLGGRGVPIADFCWLKGCRDLRNATFAINNFR